MKNIRTHLGKWTLCAASFAALMIGPMATSSRAGDPAPFDDGRVILESAGLATGDLAQACASLSPATANSNYRQYLESARPKLLDAIAASSGATWPAELRRRHRLIDRILATASAQLARTDDPQVAGRLARVRRYAQAARRNMERALKLLEPVVPALPAPPAPPPPLNNTDPVVPGVIAPPNSSPDFTWTNLTPSSDSRIIYVSDSSGSDSNSGLSSSAPIKTFTKAYSLIRDHYPDWILLKRGDTWTGETLWQMSGRSPSEPQVVWSYGASTARPKVVNNGYKSVSSTGNLAVVGIEFTRTSETSCPVPNGISFVTSAGANFLVEDCYVQGFGVDVTMMGTGPAVQNFSLRGCVIVDAFSSTDHSQGVFLSNMQGVLIEGCVFDHNGWNTAVTGAQATIYNHNMYVQRDCTNVIVRNCISADASSHGLQQRPGGVCEDNLFLRNPIAVLIGNGVQLVSGTVRRNVVLDGRDIGAGLPRGQGLFIQDTNGEDISDNVVSSQSSGSDPAGILLTNLGNTTLHDNIVYNWTKSGSNSKAVWWAGTPTGVNTIRDNVFQQDIGLVGLFETSVGTSSLVFLRNQYYSTDSQSAWFRINSKTGSTSSPSQWVTASAETGAVFSQSTAFPQPGRSIASYSASIGGTATMAAFMTEARKQSRANWRPEYTAKAVNTYIRAGFGK